MAVLVAGCGEVAVFGHTIGEKHPTSEVRRESTAPGVIVSPGIQTLKTVTLVLAPQITAKAIDDARFDTTALLDAVRSELRSRNLLDDSGSSADRTADISIDDLSLRPTSNAVVFGRVISAGRVSGDIGVHASDRSELQSFRIVAESRVSVAASGKDTNALGPLYRRFAVLVADSLAGTPGKSISAPDQPPR
jgi:hypothetical protein